MKRPVAPVFVASVLGFLVLTSGIAFWLHWNTSRWLSRPDSDREVAFSFWVDSDSKEEFLAFRSLTFELLPKGFLVDQITDARYRWFRVLTPRSLVSDPERFSSKFGPLLREVALEKGLRLRWHLAVVGKEGPLWGPRSSEDFAGGLRDSEPKPKD